MGAYEAKRGVGELGVVADGEAQGCGRKGPGECVLLVGVLFYGSWHDFDGGGLEEIDDPNG